MSTVNTTGLDSVKINGHIFWLAGISTYDGCVHLHIRPFEYTMYDIEAAVKEGTEPITVYQDGDISKPLYIFEGFTTLKSISADYSYKFAPNDADTAVTVVLSRPLATAQEITDIQEALAELAEMIGGDENG